MQVQQMNIPQPQGPRRKRLFWIRLLICIGAIICLIVGGIAWLLSAGRIISADWSIALLIAFAVLAVIFALCQWLIPFSSLASELSTSTQSQPIQIFIPVQSTPQTISSLPVTLTNGSSSPSSIWDIPYRRNPFFTGREDLLKRLHEQFTTTRTTTLTQPQAISGLGGIGKTQTAVEYAYRYRQEYCFVFWIKAVSRDTITAGFVAIIDLLNLPGKDAQDQNKMVAVVKRWLETHNGWLLIFDNADEIGVVDDFLPTGDNGHILLTTRASTLGSLANMIEVEKMNTQESMLQLLRRAKRLKADEILIQAVVEDREEAKTIVNLLDGLPLAIDQAAAYIEEAPCSLKEYQTFYHTHRMDLLQRRGIHPDYPESVATTWSLSFEHIERANPAAAELLRMFAFLDPDAIPEEIIIEGASDLGPLLASVATDTFLLANAIEQLRKFSLIRRDLDTKILSIHRLVQAVLKDKMTEEIQQKWAVRVVQAVNAVFPKVDANSWSLCERYLTQALACAELITRYVLVFANAARLMNETANYLVDHGRYAQAELLYQRALNIRKLVLGPYHINTGESFNNLAYLYIIEGKYNQAEPLSKQSLNIYEQALGLEHPIIADNLNNLASIYKVQGKYAEAELLFQRALSINEQTPTSQHHNIAVSLNNLASLYKAQGKYAMAEPLYQQALSINEQMLGPKHPDTAQALNNLASLYKAQGKYAMAGPLYQQALSINEQVLGPEHPHTGQNLNNLAQLYEIMGKYAMAEPLYQQALSINEQMLGPEHPNTAISLNNLAHLYEIEGKYAEAELLFLHALRVCDKAQGLQPLFIANVLANYVALLRKTNRIEQARTYEKRIQAILPKEQI